MYRPVDWTSGLCASKLCAGAMVDRSGEAIWVDTASRGLQWVKTEVSILRPTCLKGITDGARLAMTKKSRN
jgi:hypothetical protein